MQQFHQMFNGQPYLVQLAFREMLQRKVSARELLAIADSDDGPFADYLARLLALLNQNGALLGAVQNLLAGQPVADAESFYHLRSAGVIVGGTPRDAKFGCGLNQRYLARHVGT
jgi:hypothetical protein